MSHSHDTAGETGEEREYLCVDEFIKTMVDARTLASAFDVRLIDCLVNGGQATLETLQRDTRCNRRGLGMMLELLAANHVIEQGNGTVRLTSRFSDALKFRDLMLAKLDFAHIAAHDFIDYFSHLVTDPMEFMQRASMFRLFSYGRCFDANTENLELSRRWVRITTMLTRYESGVCFRRHGLGNYRRMLDIGGNSGEFVLQACKRYGGLEATVFDLPLVCDIGQDHVSGEPEAGRIRFIKGDALSDALPAGFDLVTFKSVLHDWPEREARHFIQKASESLKPGGTLLIFERGPLELAKTGLPFSLIPLLLFAHTFRPPDMYGEELAALGFHEITIQRIDLETPFFLVTGVKKA